MVRNLFTAHPKSIGETYTQHAAFAIPFATRLIYSGCALLVHAVLPFLFIHTASHQVTALYAQMRNRAQQKGIVENKEPYDDIAWYI